MTFSKFMQLTKVNVALCQISGVFTAEVVDKSGEVADYDTTKAAFKTWSADIEKSSGGKSLGNVRKMHNKDVCGKVIQIDYDDVNKVISGVVEVNKQTIDEADKGYLNGFSIGGAYTKVWDCPVFKGAKRFSPIIAELSVVDNPCVPDATFDAIKDMSFALVRADGVQEMRKFATRPADQAELELTAFYKSKDGAEHATKEAALAANDLIAKAALVSDPVADAVAKVDAALAVKSTTAQKLSTFINLEKGMCDVGRCAELILSLDWLRDSLDYEAAYEGDGSLAPTALKVIIGDLCKFLKMLVDEETSELMGDADKALVFAAVEAMRKVTGNAELFKDFKPATEIQADTELQKVAGDLAKITAERDTLLKTVQDLPGKIDAKFEALNKRLATVEAQPAAAPGALFIVEKDGDQRTEVKVSPVSMSPAQQRNFMNQ